MMKRILIFLAALAFISISMSNVHAQISEIKLLDNTDQCLMNCEATLEVTYQGSIEKALSELIRADFFSINTESKLSYEILEQKETTIQVPQYTQECLNKGKVMRNGTEIDDRVCSEILTGYKAEPRTLLENIGPARTLRTGDKAVIKIIASKEPGANIKWGLGFDDAYLDPWWNSSWLYRTPIYVNETTNNYYDNLTINTTLINQSKLYAEGKINANCSDLRIANTNDVELGFCWGFPFCWAQTLTYSCNTTMGAANLRLYIMGNLTALENASWYAYYGNPAAVTSPKSNLAAFYMFQNDSTYDVSKWVKVGQVTGPAANSGFILNTSATGNVAFVKTATPLNLTGNQNGWCLDYKVQLRTNDSGVIHIGAVINDSAYAGGNYSSFADGVVKLYSKWDINANTIYYFYFNTTGAEIVYDSYTGGIVNGTNYIEEICRNQTHYFYRMFGPSYPILKSAAAVNASLVRGGAADTLLVGEPLTEAWNSNSTAFNLTVRGWSSFTSPTVALGTEEANPFFGNFSLTYPAVTLFGDSINMTWTTTQLKNVTKFFFWNGSVNWFNFTLTEPFGATTDHIGRIATYGGLSNASAGTIYQPQNNFFWNPNFIMAAYPFNVTTAQGWFNATHSCFDFNNCSYQVGIIGQSLNVSYAIPIVANLSTNDTCFGDTVYLNGYILAPNTPINAEGFNWTIRTFLPDGTMAYDHWPANLVENLAGWGWNVTKSNATSHQWQLPFSPNVPVLNTPGTYAFTLTVCDPFYCNTTSAGSVVISYGACGGSSNVAEALATSLGIPLELGLFFMALLISMILGGAMMVITKSWQIGVIVLLASIMGFGIVAWIPAWVLVLLGLFGGFLVIKAVTFQ